MDGEGGHTYEGGTWWEARDTPMKGGPDGAAGGPAGTVDQGS